MRKPHTPLKNRLEQRMAQERIWIDNEAFPDPLMHSWCGAFLTIIEDDPTMTLRLVTFLQKHAQCQEELCRVGGEQEYEVPMI